MGCLKTNSVGTGRKCSCPAQLFFFDTFCPPHFCQAGQRRSGRDFFFVRRLPCLSTADFTDPCKLMPSPVCLIVSSVFCLGGVRTYIVMVRNWWMSLTCVCERNLCLPSTVSLDTTWARTCRFSAHASPHTPDSHMDSAHTTHMHHWHTPS